MVEASSLEVKIRSELEFQKPNPEVQMGSNSGAPEQTSENPPEILRELETKIRSLEIDKAVRDKQIEFITKQNEEGQQSLLSQSRYIGHLETQVTRLGGQPDQTFLQAPVAQEQKAAFNSRNQPPLGDVH